MPVEIPDPIPFDEDRTHAAYDPERAAAFWRVLAAIVPVFEEFRAEFLGKSSPVHFFWGSFDLASTRFSGRRAPERPGADAITREAYSHEVWSAGFWPGGAGVAGPAFYAYAAPEPPGFASAAVRPAKAFYHPELKEFLLMYDDVRRGARSARGAPRVPRVDVRCRRGPRRVGPQEPRALIRRLRLLGNPAVATGSRLGQGPRPLV